MSIRALIVSVCAMATAIVACGPSFQVVYEGDARFEHCYALDETASVPMQEKTECWTQWTRSYTYGQTRNRIDYAQARAKSLSEAHLMPTDEAVMGAAPGEGVGRVGRDEPVTTNAFAPPPKTMSDVDAGTPSATLDETPKKVENGSIVAVTPRLPLGAIVPTVTPREACTDRCKGEWLECRATCKSKCGACDHTYGGCMKSCF
jgi:hypothetical protein